MKSLTAKFAKGLRKGRKKYKHISHSSFLNWTIYFEPYKTNKDIEVLFLKTVSKNLTAKAAKGLRKGRKKYKHISHSRFLNWTIYFERYKTNKGIKVLFLKTVSKNLTANGAKAIIQLRVAYCLLCVSLW